MGDAAACISEENKHRGRVEAAPVDVWQGMQQSLLDNAIDEWRKRLRACIRAKGGHFEHML